MSSTHLSRPLLRHSFSRVSGTLVTPGIEKVFRVPSAIPLDLKSMESRVLPKDGSASSLSPVLDALPTFPRTVDFVCYRNSLSNFSMVLYERRGSWRVRIRGRGDGLIEIHLMPEPDENQFGPAKWGYVFEDACVEPVKSSPLHTTEDAALATDHKIDPNDEFCAVFELGLTCRNMTYRVAMAAEIDCVDGKRDLAVFSGCPPRSQKPHDWIDTMVEIKTSKELKNDREWSTFRRFKSQKFWIQSFLSGCPSILCGFRDDAGVVRSIKLFDVMKLPELADGWDASTMLGSIWSILDFLKRNIQPEKEYILSFDPSKSRMVRLDPL